jgi:hypothetical protein
MGFPSTPLAHASFTTSTASAVTTTACNTTGANLILLAFCGSPGDSLSTVTISDSAGNTWTPLNWTGYGGTPHTGTTVYYCLNPITSATHTFSAATGGTTYPGLLVQAWRGSASAALDQQHNFGNTSITSVQPGSVTPGQNNELVVSSLAMSAAGTASVDSSMTITDQVPYGTPYGQAFAYLVQTSAAAINPTWTKTGAATTMSSTIATFRSNIEGTASLGRVGHAMSRVRREWRRRESGVLVPELVLV